jgi:nucleotidyltransferase/DNA polymerase involved in DNA repair
MSTILHVDMDAFFAAVEQLDHPELRGKPVIVGAGPHERGVVSTCSYEARRFGVRSAIPSRTAYAKCPHAVFVRPRLARYRELSDRIFSIFNDFTPYVEPVSIDEAFLDITGSVHLYGSPRKLAQELRRAVHERCGVTCSVGVARNRLLAKIGSEENKPDGLAVMPDDPGEIAAFLSRKPVETIWGIGAKTAQLLRPYGITTCGDLQRVDPEQLAALLGSADAARSLRNHAFGISSDEVRYVPEPEKSVSREYTFDEDESDREKIRARLLELVGEVGRRFRREKRWAKTAKLKLRNAAFETVTRQAPFDAPVRDDISMLRKAVELFEREKTESVRLIGFGLSDIVETPEDHSFELFADPADELRQRREKLSDALDKLRERGLSIS